jgi:hypothetical protein
MVEEVKLRECPFCGSKALTILWGERWHVSCLDCQAKWGHPDKEIAIKAWNTRATSERDQAIARAAFMAGVKSGHDWREGEPFQIADDYLNSEEFKKLVGGQHG